MYPISCSNTYHHVTNLVKHGMVIMIMVAAPPPPNYRGQLKISDQNNWGGPEQKIKFVGVAKFKGGPKILGRAMNPNEIIVVVLKDIILC